MGGSFHDHVRGKNVFHDHVKQQKRISRPRELNFKFHGRQNIEFHDHVRPKKVFHVSRN